MPQPADNLAALVSLAKVSCAIAQATAALARGQPRLAQPHLQQASAALSDADWAVEYAATEAEFLPASRQDDGPQLRAV